jgi:enamine deaminase RidA (YjgF/YER057c/UK114 family)
MTWTRLEPHDVPVLVHLGRFRGASGVEEVHLAAEPTSLADFSVQLKWLHRAYLQALDLIGVSDQATILRRFFCSDLPSQTCVLETDPFSNPQQTADPFAASGVGQPPAPPAHVALWAYLIKDPHGALEKKRLGDSLSLRRGRLTHYWTPGLAGPTHDDVARQTSGILETYAAFLRRNDLSLAHNLIRTWFFVGNIEANYGEFVDARRRFFLQHGLTPQTHYIASTGIEGANAAPAAKVALDAYAIGGLSPEQVRYVKTLDHMCPTDAYGVTFERAATVSYRDRSHVFVSGTASIGDKGDVLHSGNLSRQFARTAENIEAVLVQAGASPEHLSSLTAYVRDAGDESVVRRGVRDRFGNVPLILVAARVCRPAWLVEIEGQAIVPGSRDDLPPF